MKKNLFTKLVTIAVVVVCSVLTGCASIVNGTSQIITVTAKKDGAPVTGASCKLENSTGIVYVTAPGTVTVHKSYGNLVVTCDKADTPSGIATVKSKTAGMAFGNILVGGIIGAAIDTSSGAAYDYPSMVTILMGQHIDLPVPVVLPATNKAAGTSNSGVASTEILSNATALTIGEPYKVHQLVGEELKARFVFAGKVAGSVASGSVMNYGIDPKGTLTAANISKGGHTTGTYQLMDGDKQICITVKGGPGWAIMSKCYRLFQVGVNTFVMSSVSDTFFFVYTTLPSTTGSPPMATNLHLDPVPTASSFANIADVDAVPLIGPNGKERYKAYLSATSPKAYVVGADGSFSMFTHNPAAIRNALTFCMASKLTSCWLYAVDDQVVWQDDKNKRVSLDQTLMPAATAVAVVAPAATP